MVEDSQSISRSDLARFSNAVRFAIACVVIGCSYFSIRTALSIPKFGKLFEDMLGQGSQLPALTLLVLEHQTLFIIVSLAIPVVCIALLFIRDAARALYCMGALLLIIIVECIVTFNALTFPLVSIIERMQNGPQ